MAIYCLSRIFAGQSFMPSDAKNSQDKPFSLTTILQVLYHKDNLKFVNEWIKKDAASVNLTHLHLKALSPRVNWICYQLGDPRCTCPDLPNLFQSQSHQESYYPVQAPPSPAYTPAPAHLSDFEELELNISNELTKPDTDSDSDTASDTSDTSDTSDN